MATMTRTVSVPVTRSGFFHSFSGTGRVDEAVAPSSAS
jgi:hypothetical protein